MKAVLHYLMLGAAVLGAPLQPAAAQAVQGTRQAPPTAATAVQATAPRAFGPRLVVFPFVSAEPRMGVAVADRLSQAFTERSVPPELALGLVPPLILQEGSFLSPLNLLGREGTASRHAAALLREALGAELVVTGRVRHTAQELELRLFAARAGGVQVFLVRAPAAFPDRLVRQAQAALAAAAGLGSDPEARLGIDLSSPYGTFIDGLIGLGNGFPEEAVAPLRRAAAALSAEPRWQRRAAAVQALLEPGAPTRTAVRAQQPLLAAVVALNARPFDEAQVARAFARSEEPLAGLWRALLAAQSGDAEAARAAFGSLAGVRYPFAATEALLYRLTRGELTGAAARTALVRERESAPQALSVPLGGLFVAQTLGDAALEQELAERLTRLAPAFAYPYERLSQLAFDRGDAAAAAVALRSATRLEPQSDLYWTNLGWAYYLLDVLGPSEAASERALELSPNEYIARYNLGLVQVVTGRLEEALDTYAEATARDLAGDEALDPAAIADLEEALARYPEVPEIHYVLATLLESEGRVDEAAAQYRRFAARAEGARVPLALERLGALQQPPPPLEISRDVRVGVGPEALTFARYLPGDLLYARFEVSTPGDALPSPLEVALRLRDAAGNVVAEAVRSERARLPPNTVALELGSAALELPRGLEPGSYELVIRVSARDQEGIARVPLEVGAGAPPLVRQLLGRGITLRGLSAGRPLYDAALGDAALLERLLSELSLAAQAANGTLPAVTQGRFAGQSGAALLASSSARDVRDFLGFLLELGAGTDATFAELYARWALEGAPTP